MCHLDKKEYLNGVKTQRDAATTSASSSISVSHLLAVSNMYSKRVVRSGAACYVKIFWNGCTCWVRISSVSRFI